MRHHEGEPRVINLASGEPPGASRTMFGMPAFHFHKDGPEITFLSISSSSCNMTVAYATDFFVELTLTVSFCAAGGRALLRGVELQATGSAANLVFISSSVGRDERNRPKDMTSPNSRDPWISCGRSHQSHSVQSTPRNPHSNEVALLRFEVNSAYSLVGSAIPQKMPDLTIYCRQNHREGA